MADPRVNTPFERKDVLSPLMRAKQNASNGEKVNRCPFGCDLESLDDNGYCRHVVGFTTDGKRYEPMITDARGRRVVRCKMIQVDGKMVPELLPVLPTDKLELITVSSRVYRDVPAPPVEEPEPVAPPAVAATSPAPAGVPLIQSSPSVGVGVAKSKKTA